MLLKQNIREIIPNVRFIFLEKIKNLRMNNRKNILGIIPNKQPNIRYNRKKVEKLPVHLQKRHMNRRGCF